MKSAHMHFTEVCQITIVISIHIVMLLCIRAHLWLHFDLQAAAQPTGLLQGGACDPPHCLQDPLSHLLHNNGTINITTVS